MANEGILDEVYERLPDEPKDRDRDARIVKMVRNFMFRSREYREPFLTLAEEARSLYDTWNDESKSITQRANLKLPFGYTIIETQVPQLMDIFFKGDPVIQYVGMGEEDSVWEDVLTDFHEHQFAEMGFQVKSAAFIKAMLLDGTAIAKVPYKYKEVQVVERVQEIDPLTGLPTVYRRPKVQVLIDQPVVELIPIYDFFPDWSVREPGNISEMRGLVHRTYRTYNELEQAGVYKNLDEISISLSKKGSAWSAPYYLDEDYKDNFERMQDIDQPGIKDKGRIEIWEYWGLWDPKGDGNFEEYLLTIANGDVVIRAEPNFYDFKFKPFVACPNIARDGEFYGIPELLAVRPLIKEANTLRNARLDNLNMSVNPMWVADRAAGINAKSLYSRPHGIIWTNDMNGIRRLENSDPSQGSLQEMIDIQQDIQNATALVNSAPTVSTLGKQFGRSATGVNFIAGFASSRLGLKARLLSELFYRRVAWIMLMTNRQFVTEDKWVRVLDPNAPNPFIQLPADAFLRSYDFRVDTALESGGPEGRFQKLQTVAQLLQVFENSQPGVTRADVMLETLLRPLVGRQARRFVRNEQERLQMQAQNLAATQAVNAAQGLQAPQPNAQESGVTGSPVQQQLAALGLLGG